MCLVVGLISGCNLCERNTFGGVCQLILCHNKILIIGVKEATLYCVNAGLAKITGEWQSLQINSWGRLKLNSEYRLFKKHFSKVAKN